MNKFRCKISVGEQVPVPPPRGRTEPAIFEPEVAMQHDVFVGAIVKKCRSKISPRQQGQLRIGMEFSLKPRNLTCLVSLLILRPVCLTLLGYFDGKSRYYRGSTVV